MLPSQLYKAWAWSLAAKCRSLSGGFGNQLFPISLEMGWPIFPKCTQANSIRLGLGTWLQNVGPCQEALEINFFQLGLGWAGHLFQNAPKANSVRLGLEPASKM